MDLEAASVADLKLRKWKGVDIAVVVEAGCIFQIGALGVGWTTSIVGDGSFFPYIDVADCVDGFTSCITIPTAMSIWKTAMIYKANGRIDASNHRV